MASTASPSTSPESVLNIKHNPSSLSSSVPTRVSCVTCRRRKTKCDKLSPCSTCVKIHVRCEYAPRKKASRRSRKILDGAREAELLDRLNRLEGTVKELSGQLDATQTAQPPSTSPKDDSTEEKAADRTIFGRAIKEKSVSGTDTVPAEKQVEHSFGTLVLSDTGTTRYVNQSFWSRLTEEVDDIRNLVTDDLSGEDSPSPGTRESVENDSHSFVLGYSSSNVNFKNLHPLPSQLQCYLQMFTKNVDPLHKVFHIPAMESFVREAEKNIDSLTRGKEALLFAVCFAVIVSLGPEDVKSSFGVDKKALLDRYTFGVEQALARADFLNTSELITLQAFFLYLACVRCLDDSRVGWTLTRSAIRVAQSQGLHRDGTLLGIPPFETEIRRRLWWQLIILELRDSERNGTDSSVIQGSFDTKSPLNINDSDLLPEATSFPEPRDGITDMTLSLLTCDVAATLLSIHYNRPKLGPAPASETGITVPRMENMVREFQQMLQDKYFRFCLDDTPTCWITANMCMLISYKMQLMAFLPLAQSKPRDEIPKEWSDNMWVASIKTVEYRRNLEVESTKHWHWYLKMFVQWHAIAYLLGELCIRPPDESATYAWRILDSVFQNWRDKQKHGAPDILWAPMRKLIAKARRKRQLDLLAAKEQQKQKSPVELQGFPAYAIPADTPSIFDGDGGGVFSGVERRHSILDSALWNEEWLQQVPGLSQMGVGTEIPWLLEDEALVDLGIDIGGLEGEMQWEGQGVSDWIQEFQVEGAARRSEVGRRSGW